MGFIEIILVIVGAYIAFALFARHYAKKNPDGVFEIKGPVVLVRSKRVVKLFEKGAVEHPKLILYASRLGVIIIVIVMFFMTLSVLLMMATPILYLITPTLQSTTAPIPHEIYEPQNILLIPGVNQFVPSTIAVWIGFILAIVIHEFAHGFVSRVEKISVKSAGIVLAVIPIGAFVDPDETELKNASIKSKLRIYGAGVASNMIVGLICVFAAIGIVGYLLPAAVDATAATNVARNIIANPLLGIIASLILPIQAKALPISVVFSGSVYTSLFNVPWFVWSIIHTLFWTGWISIGLAAFNALPILPLDGGFFAWGWVGDKLKNRGISERTVNIFSACMSIIVVSMLVAGIVLSAIILPSI